MKIKVCKICGISKEQFEFYTNSNYPDLLDTRCKSCMKEISKVNYELRQERLKSPLATQEIEESVKTKICTKCNIRQTLSCYSKHKRKSRGNSWCNTCQSDYLKIYNINNKEKIKNRRRERDQVRNQSAEEKQRKRQWIKDNPSYNKEYRSKNKEHLEIRSRQYRKDNREKINKQKLERKYSDPLTRLLVNRRARRHAILKHKFQKTKEALGCTVSFWREYLEQRFDENMSWGNYGSYWHLDEVIPCSAWDLENPIEQKACFHYMNSQPLERFANLSKGGSNRKINYTAEKQEFLMILKALGEI